MTDENKSPPGQDLLQVLLEKKLISEAQSQLVQADQAVTGMPLDEILLARGWVTEKILSELAPWLNEGLPQDTFKFDASKRNEEDNFKHYRRLMERILGTSWD